LCVCLHYSCLCSCVFLACFRGLLGCVWDR
jgi:hypothetical protein